MNHKYLTKILVLTTLIISTACIAPRYVIADQMEDELFLIAQKAFEDGFYDVSLRYIEQFQQKYPNSQKSVQTKLLLGQCYFFKNQYLKAFEIFQSLTQFTEFRDATLFWLSETYFKGGDYKQAEKNYRQLINTYPNSSYLPQTLYSLGWTYFEQANYSKAKETFTTLISRFPAHNLSEEAAFKIGECSYNEGNHEIAIKFFKDFITIYSKSSRLHEANFFIAESYYQQDNYLSAITYYAQSADKSYDPKISLLSHLGLGWSYFKMQKFDLSEKSFLAANQIAQDKNIPDDDILIGLATLYAEAGNNQKAAETYQKLIIKSPQSLRLAQAYLGKANCDYAQTNYASAITNYQTLIEKFSKDTTQSAIIEKTYYGLAWTYLKSGKVEQAIASFQDIVNKSTNPIARASALTQIGDAYQEINVLDKAIQIYDQILREYPNTIYTDYAQFRQGIALLKANQIEAATLSFQSLQANFPKSKYRTEVKYYLSLAYFKKEQWAQSITTAQAYLDEANDNKNFIVEAEYLLGLANFNLQKYNPALNIFQKLVKNSTNPKDILQTSELYSAKSLFALNKTKEAVDKFYAIPKSYPATEAAAEAMLWLGDYYLNQEQYPLAIESYNQFLKTFPGSEKNNLVYYELGQSYQGANQFDQALNAYKHVSDHPNKEIYAKAKLAIADIFSKDMDPQAAIATYQNIAQTIPEFKKEALLRVAEIHKNNNAYAKAIHVYTDALDTTPALNQADAAALQFEIGDTYELMHDSTKAIETYLKIAYLYPNEQDWIIKSYLRLARIFEDKTQWEQAVTIYNKILLLKTDEAVYAKERLDWISTNTKTPIQPGP